MVLGFLADAARFRRPDGLRLARPFAVYGALGFGVLSVAHQVIAAITTHKFVTGHDFTNHAADQAIRTGTALTVDTYLNLPVALAFGAGVVMVSMNSMRTGLITRFMGILGCIVGVLYILPLSQSLSILTVFWLIALGTLLMGRWPSGDPPAWEAGEARPWPSAAEQRQAREGARGDTRRGGRAPRDKPAPAKAVAAPSDAVADGAPRALRARALQLAQAQAQGPRPALDRCSRGAPGRAVPGSGVSPGTFSKDACRGIFLRVPRFVDKRRHA